MPDHLQRPVQNQGERVYVFIICFKFCQIYIAIRIRIACICIEIYVSNITVSLNSHTFLWYIFYSKQFKGQ